MRWVLLLVVAAVATVVGLEWGWRFVLAPLLGLAIWRWASASLRSMAGGAAGADGVPPSGPDPEPVARDERVVYWCQECGTEYLLLVRGSGRPPRHCGERMHERVEVLS